METILHSSDGITWTKSSSEGGGVAFLAEDGGFGVAYNPIDKMWVAVGISADPTDSYGTILHSSDGITWSASSSEGGGVAFDAGRGGRGVAYNPIDKMWVAVGRSTDPNKTILHSSDGITWSVSSSEGGGVAFDAGRGGRGVAYTPGLVVPIGNLNNLTV